jgi:predicted AlkP superfamily phosphohydrolase/phosphomutase
MATIYRGPAVLVIGLDGATMRLLGPLMAAGRLPHLRRLSAAGASGLLRSTIRPESSVAWSSFATGLEPGRHGVFGFVSQSPGSYRARLTTAADLAAPPFWAHLAGHGVRAGVFNVPVAAYPPRSLPAGSFTVGGLGTPSLASHFTWPADLKAGLLAHVAGYRLDVDEAGTSDERLITELAELTRVHLAAARYLVESRQPDLFVAVFMATDRIQHYLWRHLDARHPRHDAARSPRLAGRIHALYEQLDAAVGELAGLAAADALILVMSDHGFDACGRALSLNAWLAGQGWLQLRAGAAARGRSAALLGRLRRLPGLRRLKAALPGLRRVALTEAWRPDPTDWIAWEGTAAYFSDVGGIRINLQGREPQGVVAPAAYDALIGEMSGRLLALRDPLTGHAPVAAVYRREELYTGPCTDRAPDLIVEPRRDADDPRANYLLAYGAPPGSALFFDPPRLSGNHDQDGILIAAGPGVRPGAFASARLWDLAPTICHALGVSPPEGLDGRALIELLPRGDGRPGAHDGASSAGATAQDQAAGTIVAEETGLSAEDEAAIAARLRALGYLS